MPRPVRRIIPGAEYRRRIQIDIDGPFNGDRTALKPLLARFVASGLESGLLPVDAVKRATSALNHITKEARVDKRFYDDQILVEDLLIAALRSRGAETGYVLAVRTLEAVRLINEWETAK